MELVFAFLGLIVLDLAALRWSANSVEAWDSLEWACRRQWRGFA